MQDMSDKELDNLFKEAAEGFTPPPDPSAWQQMSSMLDKAPVEPGGFWNWKTISGLTATGLIAVTALWYGLRDNEGTITKTNEQYGSNNATQGVVQEQKEQTNPTGNENLASAKPLENESANKPVVTAQEKSNRNKVASQGIERSTRKPVQHVEVTSDVSVAQDGADQAILQSRENEYAVSDQKVAVVPDNTNERMFSPERNTSAVSAKSDSTTIVIEEVIKSDSVSESTDKPDDKKKERKEMRLSLRAAVSPDFSSINFFSAGKTGINYGLLAGFSFNRHWSVYTGVISSRKLYDTKDVSGNYSLDGHDYPMKAIDGDCRILDIPVNVYYTFFPDRSFSLRAGLGFSSYIMQTENYRYLVDYYGHDAYYKKNVKGENNEWFKMLNVSVVVSKKLSNRFSAEFEPFVKAPLAGVGEGKVSLVSMGAFINLKYDLLILK